MSIVLISTPQAVLFPTMYSVCPEIIDQHELKGQIKDTARFVSFSLVTFPRVDIMD